MLLIARIGNLRDSYLFYKEVVLPALKAIPLPTPHTLNKIIFLFSIPHLFFKLLHKRRSYFLKF